MPRTLIAVLVALVVAAPGSARSAGDSAASAQDVRKVAVDLVWASIRGQYGKVWLRLDPRHQAVTTRAFWESCQRKRAAQTAGIQWLSVRATDVYPDRVFVPVLGRSNVTAVTITARLAYRGRRQTISDTNYWTPLRGAWRGLWQPETYRAYAKRRCPPN
jgi:hypothetical protein